MSECAEFFLKIYPEKYFWDNIIFRRILYKFFLFINKIITKYKINLFNFIEVHK